MSVRADPIARLGALRRARLAKAESDLTAAIASRSDCHHEALLERASVRLSRAALITLLAERRQLFGTAGGDVLLRILRLKEREAAARADLDRRQVRWRDRLQVLRGARLALRAAKRSYSDAVRSTEKWMELSARSSDK